MSKEFIAMPSITDMSEEAVLLEWRVSTGQDVERDQVIAIVETDKVNVDVPSPYRGTIAELLISTDETVSAGTLLCAIWTETG